MKKYIFISFLLLTSIVSLAFSNEQNGDDVHFTLEWIKGVRENSNLFDALVPLGGSRGRNGLVGFFTDDSNNNNNNDNNNDNRIVYSCGKGVDKDMEEIFKNYKHDVLTQDNIPFLQPNDIVVFGVHGLCPREQLIESGIKVLFINTEPHDIYLTTDHLHYYERLTRSSKRNQFYKIGPYPNKPKKNTMQVYRFARQMLHEYNTEVTVRNLIYASNRPVNSGEHFLLYATSHCIPYREEAVGQLSDIGEIHVAGKCHGQNVIREENIVPTKLPKSGQLYERIRNHVKHYRYFLVMENDLVDGYITQKILNAFLGGAIPIYYGSKEIFTIFNEKAMIYYDVMNPESAIRRITFLEVNKWAYYKMLREPILASGWNTGEGDVLIGRYFSLTNEIGNGRLRKKILNMMDLPDLA